MKINLAIMNRINPLWIILTICTVVFLAMMISLNCAASRLDNSHDCCKGLEKIIDAPITDKEKVTELRRHLIMYHNYKVKR